VNVHRCGKRDATGHVEDCVQGVETESNEEDFHVGVLRPEDDREEGEFAEQSPHSDKHGEVDLGWVARAVRNLVPEGGGDYFAVERDDDSGKDELYAAHHAGYGFGDHCR